MVLTTKQQRKSLKVLLSRMENPPSYREFRKSVQPTFGCDGAITVRWCNMWIAIECDGYRHS